MLLIAAAPAPTALNWVRVLVPLGWPLVIVVLVGVAMILFRKEIGRLIGRIADAGDGPLRRHRETTSGSLSADDHAERCR
jgi:hypothetical protein